MLWSGRGPGTGDREYLVDDGRLDPTMRRMAITGAGACRQRERVAGRCNSLKHVFTASHQGVSQLGHALNMSSTTMFFHISLPMNTCRLTIMTVLFSIVFNLD